MNNEDARDEVRKVYRDVKFPLCTAYGGENCPKRGECMTASRCLDSGLREHVKRALPRMPQETTVTNLRCPQCKTSLSPTEEEYKAGFYCYNCNWYVIPSLGENKSNLHDPVNHPAHYNSHPSGVECITISRHMNFNLGNVLKYIWRAGLRENKSHIEDLKKARWYLEDEIKRLEGEQK